MFFWIKKWHPQTSEWVFLLWKCLKIAVFYWASMSFGQQYQFLDINYSTLDLWCKYCYTIILFFVSNKRTLSSQMHDFLFIPNRKVLQNSHVQSKYDVWSAIVGDPSTFMSFCHFCSTFLHQFIMPPHMFEFWLVKKILPQCVYESRKDTHIPLFEISLSMTQWYQCLSNPICVETTGMFPQIPNM